MTSIFRLTGSVPVGVVRLGVSVTQVENANEPLGVGRVPDRAPVMAFSNIQPGGGVPAHPAVAGSTHVYAGKPPEGAAGVVAPLTVG